MNLLDRHVLVQSVSCRTHIHGNTLDFIITRADGDIHISAPSEELYISDHCFVLCDINAPRPQSVRRRVPVRNLRCMDIHKLKNGLDDLNKTGLRLTSLGECVHYYDSALSDLLDKLAPMVLKSVVCRTRYPWFSDHLKELKKRPPKS